MADTPYVGSCLCGAVQYQVDQIESEMAHCHCTMCRKFHGAGFATYAEARVDNFRWLCGEEMLESYTAENNSVRRFCKKCGSSMTFAAAHMTEFVEFAAGTLDSSIPVVPEAHIFVGYKANWVEIVDRLPQFFEGRVQPDNTLDTSDNSG